MNKLLSRDAGFYGGGSVLLAIILLGVTVYEHFKGYSVQTFWLGTLVIIFFCFGAFIAWRKESQKVDDRDAQIERISKPDRCPVVRISLWGEGREGPLNSGFYLQSEGETAEEIRLEDFEIEPSVIATSRVLPTVIGHQIGTGYIPVWIKGDVTASKWDLKGTFQRASDARDGRSLHGRPDYTVTVTIVYRDHNDFWYRTNQEIIYVPARFDFEFGPITHKKLGLQPLLRSGGGR
jgi:hypothetical protein